MELAERFWSKVDASGDCWEWAAGRFSDGYGQFWMDGTNVGAHRVAWLLLVGPVLPGMQLDHLCRVRHCVNPDHLEPVTCAQNTRRSPISPSGRSHCVHGHEFTPENTYSYVNYGLPTRSCRTCRRLRAVA